jgi:type IV secretion system protein TrbL
MPLTPPLDALSPVHEHFAVLRALWFGTLFDYANHLFLMLALLEVGLGAILWMASQQEAEFVGLMLLRRIVWIGFMYAVLLFSNSWITAVMNSFIEAGATAAGVPALNPGELATQGITIAAKMLWQVSELSLLWRPVTLLTVLFSGLGVALAYFVIAIQLSLTLIESYIVTGGGVLLLGFGAFRGTASISEKYLSYVVAVGVKLFVIYLIVGAGATLAPLWASFITQENMQTFSTPLAILGGAAAYGLVAWQIPSLAASAVSGAVGMGIHEAIGTTVMATRLAMSSVAAPMALAGGAWAAGGIARQTARLSGGGVGGAIRGLGAGVGAVGREAMQAAVPRLGRSLQNLQEQRDQPRKP